MNNCKFCYLPLDECNCPSEKTAVRQSGKDYFAELTKNIPPIFSGTFIVDQPKPKKILVEGEVTVNEYEAFDVALIKNKEFQKSEFDCVAVMKMKYLGLPAGKRLKVTIEVLDDENG